MSVDEQRRMTFDLDESMVKTIGEEFDVQSIADKFAKAIKDKSHDALEKTAEEIFGQYGKQWMKRTLELGEKHTDTTYETLKKAVEKKEKIVPIPEPQPEPVIEKKPEKPKKQGIRCEHCDGTGVCAAGSPYDKSHGQMFGAKVRLTSCTECLLVAGEHKNSKKLVDCRFCGGDGEV